MVPPPLNDDSYSFTVYAKPTGTSDAQASEILDGTFPPMFDVPCPSEGDQPDNCLTGD
jgi:hypothetical protein